MKIKKFNWNNKEEAIIQPKQKQEEIIIQEEKLLNYMEQFLIEVDIQEVSKKNLFQRTKKFCFVV